MKANICILLTVFCFSESSAQGLVRFQNRGLRDPQLGIYEALVTLPDGTRAAGPGFTAGIFLVGSGGALDLIATSPFRPAPFGGAFFPIEVSVPGIGPGLPATFRARVWETTAGSYEGAVASGLLHGEFPTRNPDNNILVRLGSPLGLGDVPNVDGMLPLTLVPEPSAARLTVAGFVALMIAAFLRKPS